MMIELEVETGGGRGEGLVKTDRELISIPDVIKKRVCTTFVEDSFSNGHLCQCGGSRDSHATVSLNDYFSSAIVSHWDSALHSSEAPTDAFGEVEFGGASKRHSYFLRLSSDTPPATAYTILTSNWGLPKPNLVLSVVGGVGRSKVKPKLREVLRQGLVRAAQSTGAWILSGGLREGIDRCLGEAVRDHTTAASSDSLTKVVAIGIAPWGLVNLRDELVNPEGSFPAEYFVTNTSRDSYCLDTNHQAFLLVDDGSTGRRGGEARFRASLENYISQQRTGKLGSGSMDIPVLCTLVSGELYMLERLDLSLKKCIPWMVLSGSGGLADLVTDVLENVAAAPVLPAGGAEGEGEATTKINLRERVAEKVQKHFPSEPDVDKLVDKLLNVHKSQDLISIYHLEQEGPEEFDTVLLKALVRASKQRLSSDASLSTEELKLAVTWNRVDIARSELFTGDIQWKNESLESFMTDALVNDKPQFVRLFIENGLNVQEYMTFGRLEELYRSISDSSVAYTLLQRHLSERQGVAGTGWPAADPAKGLTLYEVSQLLEDLLGDVCQTFFDDKLEIEGITSRRKTIKKLTTVLQKAEYREHRCIYPWASLFTWAVLQNRSEMAVFFWEMMPESVLSALSACKLLRELCKLENETETKHSLKELAMRFENLAHDVFSKCYQSSESRSFVLLKKKSLVWKGATCLQMAMEADARHFFSHDGVQTLLSQIWWGDMDRSTENWKLVLTLFIPPLCYTNLISFREVEEAEDGTPEEAPKARDIDWLYAETVFSFADIKRIQAKQEELTPIRSTPKGNPTKKSPKKQCFLLSRWKQFWYAPVTAFLGNVLMYFLFLLLFAYVLLVDFKPPPPKGPSPMELLMYFWVFTIVCEEIRGKFFIIKVPIRQRIRQYTQDLWHKCDLIAITLFLIGLCCRMFRRTFWFARAALCLDYMVFTLRLIHIFAIHKQLGPKIIIVGKMMKDVFFFLFFLAVWMMAYGVANQGLIYSFDPSADRILRRVFYRPYLHIFGQIPYEQMDSGFEWDVTCTTNVTEIDENMEPCRDTRYNWMVVILLMIYLLVTNILLINLLIAMFSYTFTKVQERSDAYWKFQRFNVIAEYHSRPCLAPPFIIFSHFHQFIKRNIRKVPSEKIHQFAVDLNDKANNRMMTWENIQKENLLSAEGKKQRESEAERLKRMSVKVDGVLKQTAEIKDVDRRLRVLESEMEFCSATLLWMADALCQSGVLKAAKPPPTHKVNPSSQES